MGAIADRFGTDAEITAHAEQAVIGGLLACNDAYDNLAGQLTPSHFADVANSLLYAGIARLIDEGRSADPITLGEHLEARGELERAGGLAYLVSIAQNLGSAGNLRRYAEIVLQRATVRGGMRVAQTLTDSLLGAGKLAPTDALLDAAAALEALTQRGASDEAMTYTPSQLAHRTIERIDRVFSEGARASGRVPSGLAPLDAKLGGGGFGAGDLIIIAGRPGIGKSVFKAAIADAIARPDHPNGGHIVKIELEMSPEEDGDRQLAAHSGIELGRIQSAELADEDWSRLTVGAGKVAELQQTADYQPGQTLGQIRAKCRKLKRQHGRLAAVFIDYLQLIVQSGENRTQEITKITAGLKGLAKELGCPVFALSQLSRGVEQRADKRPTMSDLRESGSIEQDANTILLLYRDEYYNADSPEKGVMEIHIAKQRQGRAGETVRVQFDGACSRIRELAPGWRPEERPATAKQARRNGWEADLV
ncbi:replicative DNA helicase [Chitinimonas lacunae]|uniref:DNA 5'-3' helicase n=1 Tax=Chitinimonas lacunae TaxID=1963018 RepID=A0ABV8MYD0_9NEIS